MESVGTDNDCDTLVIIIRTTITAINITTNHYRYLYSMKVDACSHDRLTDDGNKAQKR